MPSETDVRKGLTFLSECAKVYLAAFKRTEPHVVQRVARSFLNTAAGRHIFELISFHGYNVVPVEAQRCLRAAFSMGQSRVQEKNFHGHRQATKRFFQSPKMTNSRRWMQPVQDKLASTDY
eukprot:4853734-Pyramimonas_sp.AAC.1